VQFSICRNSVSILLLGCCSCRPLLDPRSGAAETRIAAQLSSDASSEVRAMTNRSGIDAQVQTLIAQINDMKSEQQRALQEARNLRMSWSTEGASIARKLKCSRLCIAWTAESAPAPINLSSLVKL